jgi:S-adenosylmethionine synthetase
VEISKSFFASESVTEGESGQNMRPSGRRAMLDAIIAKDKKVRVTCEVTTCIEYDHNDNSLVRADALLISIQH